MAYQFTVEEHPGYLHAMADGERTPENAHRALLDAYSACVAKQQPNLLLELRLSGPQLGMLRIFEVISDRAQDGSRLRKIAYVDSVPGREAEFAETVAANRGVNVRLFPDAGTAKRWLSEAGEP